MNDHCPQGRDDQVVAEPPMRLIMACMAIGMIVGAFLSPGKPGYVDIGAATSITTPVGR